MKIIDCDSGNIEKLNMPVSIALGNFDGLHLGHQELINRAVMKENEGFYSGVLLFKNHTTELFNNSDEECFLTELEDKIELLKEAGISVIFLQTFDREFASIEKSDFIKNVLVEKLQVGHIVVGRDYKFGKKAMGNVDDLINVKDFLGFSIDICDDVEYLKRRISSTRIREEIRLGNLKNATAMLGRYYHITGEITHGASRGRKLGYPTANLECDFPYVIPKRGVYITRMKFDSSNEYTYGMTNIGTNPTFEISNIDKIETHLFDFSENIYGKKAKLEFIEFIRDDYKFDSKEALSEQIHIDEENIRRKLESIKVI